MDKLGLARFLAPETDISPSGLVIAGVGHRGYLFIPVHRGYVYLYIIGPGHRSRAVLGRQLDRAEMEAQALYQRLGLSDQLFKGLVGILGAGVLHHFNLIELMAPYHAPFIGTVAAGLLAEAGGVGHILPGKLLFGQYLVHMQADKSRFGRGKHEVFPFTLVVFQPIDLVFELGELPRNISGLAAQHMGHHDQLVTVIEMCFNKVIEKGPLEPCAHAPVNPETAARKLGPPGIVDKPQVGAQVHMVFRLEIKLLGAAEHPQNLVVFLAARLEVGVRQVGKPGHYLIELFLGIFAQVVGILYFVRKLPRLQNDGADIFSGLFHAGYFLGNLVLTGLELVGFLDKGSSFPVQL